MFFKKKYQTSETQNPSDVKAVKSHGEKQSPLHAGGDCLLTGTHIRRAAAGVES